MSEMLSAEGWEAVFSYTDADGKAYFASNALVFWSAQPAGLPVGIVIDDKADDPSLSGGLREADTFSNFVGYRRTRSSRPVTALPGGGYYAVYRMEDGSLVRDPVTAWVLDEDGRWSAKSTDAHGQVEEIVRRSCLGIWHEVWGDEPSRWSKPDQKRTQAVPAPEGGAVVYSEQPRRQGQKPTR